MQSFRSRVVPSRQRVAAYAPCLTILAVGLAACGSSSTEPEPDPPPTAEVSINVEGQVFDESDQEPIEGADLAVFDGENELASTTSDAEGAYEMSFTVDEGSVPDEVRLEAVTEGYEDFETTVHVAETITYDVGMTFDGTDASASGVVSDEDSGDVIEGATVTGTDAQTHVTLFEATTNFAGAYEVEFRVIEEPDTVLLTVEAEGYEPSEKEVPFSADMHTDVELAVPRFSGGQGTEADPYQIETATHLQNMREYLDAHYILIADIDAGETAQWNDGAGFEPIGEIDLLLDPDHRDQDPFTGSLDADGYHITGLVIDRPDEDAVGLFAFTIEAELTDLTLIEVSIVGANRTGGIVGWAHGESGIYGAHVSGEVTGYRRAGGLAGQLSFGEIHDSSAEASIEAELWYAGGLVGELVAGQIHGSHATGAVDGHSRVGGLVGQADESSIHDSYAEGDVNGQHTAVGGLIGRAEESSVHDSYAEGNVNGSGTLGGLIGDTEESSVHDSYAEGNVDGGSALGGLIGFAGEGSEILRSYAEGNVEGSGAAVGGLIGALRSASVHASYARGAVTGNEEVGGLVGLSFFQSELVETYATGSVNGTDAETTGGLIGGFSGTLSDSYWDTQTSGLSNGVGEGSSAGIEGLETIQMLGNNAETYMTGFDFDETWVTVPFGYPELHWQE